MARHSYVKALLALSSVLAALLALPTAGGASIPSSSPPGYDPTLVSSYADTGGRPPADGLRAQAAVVNTVTVNGTANALLRPGTSAAAMVLTGTGFTPGSEFRWTGPLEGGVTNSAVGIDSTTQVALTVSVSTQATGPYSLWWRESPSSIWIFVYTQQVYRGDGTLFPLATPARIADDRISLGGRSMPLAAGETWRIAVAGQAGIPTTATAVSVNLTAVGGPVGGWLALYPAGGTVPGVSSVNFGDGGQIVPNHLIVPLGVDGSLDLHNGVADPVSAILDIDGYISGDDIPGGLLYSGVTPRRNVDMRTSGSTIAAGQTVSIAVTNAAGVPYPAGYVIDANVTITNQTTGGYATVFNGDAESTAASTHNWGGASVDTANRVAVRTGTGGTIRVTNGSAGTIQVIVDVFGYFQPYFGYRFAATTPTRVLDTRTTTPLPPGDARVLDAQGWLTPQPVFVVGNLTGTAPSSTTYMQMWDGPSKPAVSNLNLGAGETRANSFVQALPTNGQLNLANAFGTTHAIIDVAGYFNP